MSRRSKRRSARERAEERADQLDREAIWAADDRRDAQAGRAERLLAQVEDRFVAATNPANADLTAEALCQVARDQAMQDARERPRDPVNGHFVRADGLDQPATVRSIDLAAIPIEEWHRYRPSFGIGRAQEGVVIDG